MFAVEVLEHRNTEALEDEVEVEEAGQHLGKVGHHVAPRDGFRSVAIMEHKWIKTDVLVSFGKQEYRIAGRKLFEHFIGLFCYLSSMVI